jgi:hypothetical protein
MQRTVEMLKKAISITMIIMGLYCTPKGPPDDVAVDDEDTNRYMASHLSQ